MSTPSKIPQNRPSRIAGPSRLPGRSLRPPTVNSNLVVSAKQLEKKQDVNKQDRYAKSSNYKSKPRNYGDGVQNNDNKHSFLNSKSDEIKMVNADNSENYQVQQYTVNMPSKVDAKISFPCTTGEAQFPSNDPAQQNISSIRQRLNAIKTLQRQRNAAFVNEEQQNSQHASTYSSGQSKNTPGKQEISVSGSRSYRSGSTPKRQLLPPGSYKFNQTATSKDGELQNSTSVMSSFNRPEQRKKYLDVKDPKSVESDKKPEEDSVQPKQHANSNQTYLTKKRHVLKTPPPRSVKIARPVIRPKKTVSPISPKPYVSRAAEISARPEKSSHDLHAGQANDVPADERIIHNFLKKCSEDEKENSNAGASSQKRYAARPLASEDGAILPITHSRARRTLLDTDEYLPTAVNSKSVQQELCTSTVTENDNCEIVKDDSLNGQVNGEYSSKEPYSAIKPQLARSNSPDAGDLREAQSSPDCENTSESSADTVITNTRCSKFFDPSDSKDSADEDHDKEEFSYLSHNYESNLDLLDVNHAMVHVSGHIGYPSYGQRNESDVSGTVCTPKSNLEKGETFNPDLVAKKNDSLEDGLQQSDEESEEGGSRLNLSEIIDLPALHKSTLITDFTFATDGEDPDFESEPDEETHIPEKKELETSSSASITNARNKSLLEDESGTVNGQDLSHNQGSMQFTDTCQYTESAELMNGAAPVLYSKRATDFSEGTVQSNAELREEMGKMRILLLQLHNTIEHNETEWRRQEEENKRLAIKNQKLTQVIASLTQQLESQKLRTKSVSNSRAVLNENEQFKVEAKEDLLNSEVPTDESSNSRQKVCIECSDEMELKLKKAWEEIRGLRESFDHRIRGTECQLQSALELFHK